MRNVLMLCIVVVLVCPLGEAQSEPCTEKQHLQAEKQADTLRSWDALYSSYQKYGHCEDVDAAEGYSESVARILVDHWDTLPRLAQLIDSDPAFGEFVDVDSTMGVEDLAAIKTNARLRCPGGLRTVCDKLTMEAEEAIKQDNELFAKPGVTPQDIYEAVARYQIRSLKSVESYCVTIDGESASEAFLKRLQSLPVKDTSSCELQNRQSFMRWIVDKQTKKKAAALGVGGIQWFSPSEVRVDGGYQLSNMTFAEGTYKVVWNGTQWTVAEFNVVVFS